MNLTLKTALITGATSGIGLAIARVLAARGVNLLLVARTEGRLAEIARDLSSYGVDVEFLAADLAAPRVAKSVFDWVEHVDASVDLLINNAGFGRWGELLEIERQTYVEMLQLNVVTLTELCHLFLPPMIQRGEGGIINVGSTGSFVPVPYAAVYSASKAYVLMLTEALHGEYADRGIRFMALCPGGTRTHFAAVAGNGGRTDEADLDSPESVAEWGMRSFLEGKIHVITGRRNRKVAWLPRIFSRQKVIQMVGDAWKKRIGRLATGVDSTRQR